MLRLVDIIEKTTDHITFRTEEIEGENNVVYVVYDTSTGLTPLEDYYGWRVTTAFTSTGQTTQTPVIIRIDNADIYPSTSPTITDYTELNNRLFQLMSLHEYQILHDVLIRLDLVRRRLPNPGFTLSSTNNVGQNGTVAFSGGFYKKMTVEEILRMMAGTIVEINATPPRTNFWPLFQNIDADKMYNPYFQFTGTPYEFRDLVVTGTVIRCLVALGIFEIDISFSTSDSGLQLTFDHAGPLKGWHDSLLAEYKETKALFKWNHANHRGVGVGSVPFAAFGIFGTLLNNVNYGGELALNSILGFNARGSVPM